jgi:hypothetical protein
VLIDIDILLYNAALLIDIDILLFNISAAFSYCSRFLFYFGKYHCGVQDQKNDTVLVLYW